MMVVPTEEQVLALADACPTPHTRAFVLTAGFSGLRLFEVGRLLPGDLNGNRLHVRQGKGGKSRTSVILEPGLSALLGVLDDGPFRTLRGNPWERRSVNRWWSKARVDAGMPDFRFHSLRHFHATSLIDRGVADVDIAIQLGHFKKSGHPNVRFVHEVYAHPSVDRALERVAMA